MKIYIAGKISGLVYEDALRAFAEAAVEIERCGHEAVNPMKEVSTPDLPWVEYMERDIPLLLSCDGIYLLPNWKESTGARIEKVIAEHSKMLIITHGYQGNRGEIFATCKECGTVLEEGSGVFTCGGCRKKLKNLSPANNANLRESDQWIDCSAVGCSEKFIQTDPDAEVDLCPPCDAALLRAVAQV